MGAIVGQNAVPDESESRLLGNDRCLAGRNRSRGESILLGIDLAERIA
jgi:hypothetical protein